MAYTDAQYQTLIVEEVGDTASGVIASNITAIWELYGDTPNAYLRYLLAKRKAIDVLMGTVREQVNQLAAGVSSALSDKMRHLKTMRDDVSAEIEVETAAQTAAATTGRVPVSGQLTTTAPFMAPAGWPDPNAARLRGDPNPWRR